MKEYNKIYLCEEMLVQSVNFYENSKKDTDYIPSILIAGAVLEIITPLLIELNIETKDNSLFKVYKILNTSENKKNEKKEYFYFTKLIYNSLKHAGHGKNLPASNDLKMKANLKEEAEILISKAVNEYNRIPEEYISQHYINNTMSAKTLKVLQSW